MPSAQCFNIGTAKRNNRPELVERFYKDGDYPHYGTIVRKFKTWNNAMKAAGFTPRAKGERDR